MIVRSLFVLVLGTVAAAAQQAASSPKLSCQTAITAEQFSRLSESEKAKYQAVEDGDDRGKFKPRYLERAGAGECQGRYANPCGHSGISTELVDTDSCSMMKAIFRSNKISPVKPTDPGKQQSLAPAKKKQLERIPDGPDAGKYKPKYYQRIKSGSNQGRWASPCGHQGISTEEVDSNSCAEIQRLVRESR